MYVSDPQMPLFLDLLQDTYYYLAAGRWFEDEGPRERPLDRGLHRSARRLRGGLDPDGPMGAVLAAVPNTQEARDAALLSTVPHRQDASPKSR